MQKTVTKRQRQEKKARALNIWPKKLMKTK